LCTRQGHLEKIRKARDEAIKTTKPIYITRPIIGAGQNSTKTKRYRSAFPWGRNVDTKKKGKNLGEVLADNQQKGKKDLGADWAP